MTYTAQGEGRGGEGALILGPVKDKKIAIGGNSGQSAFEKKKCIKQCLMEIQQCYLLL